MTDNGVPAVRIDIEDPAWENTCPTCGRTKDLVCHWVYRKQGGCEMDMNPNYMHETRLVVPAQGPDHG